MATKNLNDYFRIRVSTDQLKATLHYTDLYDNELLKLTEQKIIKFLQEHQIVYGLNQENISKLIHSPTENIFPLLIAEGKPAEEGKDGSIEYHIDVSEKIKIDDDNLNFRDMFKIPTVSEGERLATMIEPTPGKEGMNVYGKKIRPRPGKRVPVRAGKNVQLDEEAGIFYAEIEGQISISERLIEVHPEYVVHDTLSMETGNLDFVGSITIHGDVPTGYEVKAGGDIKILGIVEAAHIEAKGSVYIAEGLAGLQTGKVVAGKDVHIGYINQGIVEAKESILVENSIVHSTCKAGVDIICKLGNIIGGNVTAEKTIEANSVGNRLNTKTEINFSALSPYIQERDKLLDQKKDLKQRLKQLQLIGEKLKGVKNITDPQMKRTIRRQLHSMKETKKQYDRIIKRLEQIDQLMDQEEQPTLRVQHTLFPQVIVSFGRYRQNFQKEHRRIYVTMEENEIVFHPL